MKFDAQSIEKPVRKLRKLLKKFSRDPLPDEVHALRTQARRVEAVMAALDPHHNGKARHLRKTVSGLRKVAGDVRDMDVLIEEVLSLCEKNDKGAMVRLIEALSELRIKHVRKLRTEVEQHRKNVCKGLKRFTKKATVAARSLTPNATATPQILATELINWPRLTAENLHPFRIRAKELRYILQLAPDAARRQIKTLGKLKDSVGEWHDWMELGRIAKKALDGRRDVNILRQLRTIEAAKLREALAVSNDIRKQYFRFLEEVAAAGDTKIS